MVRSLRHLGRVSAVQRKGRAALTAAGIALGVSLFFGALVANASSLGAIQRATDAAAGGVDVVVTPVGDFRQAVLSGDVRAKAGALPQVETVVGAIVLPTSLSTADGQSSEMRYRGSDPVILVGVDPSEVASVYTFRFRSGRQVAPGAAEVAVGRRLADALGLRVGDAVAVATPDGNRRAIVAGILAATGPGQLSNGNVVFTSLDWARAVTARFGAITQIFVDLDDGVDAARWMRTHGAALGRGINVQSFADASVGAVGVVLRRQMTALGSLLDVLAATLLFVAGFLIYLTLSTAVVERVRMYGTLRALGARRSQIRRLVLTEAIELGAVATASGLVVGLGVAAGLIALTSRLLPSAVPTSLTVPPWTVAAAVALGVLTSLGSAALPARRASELDPVDAIRGDFAREVRLSRSWIIGLGALAVGGALLLRGTSVLVMGLAAPLLLFGAVAIVPVMLKPIALVTGAVTKRLARGIGEVAVLHIAKERTRSGYTLALVMVVMATVIGIRATYESFVRSLDQQATPEFGADLRIEAPSTFPPGLAAELASVEGVRATSPVALSVTNVTRNGDQSDRALIVFADPHRHFDVNRTVWRRGNRRAAEAALAGGGSVVISDATASRLGLRVGERVTLRTGRGTRSFTVAGTVEMSNIVPTVYVGFEDGRRLFGIRNPSVLTVAVREGWAPETVRAAIHRDLRSRIPLLISTLDEVKSEVRASVAAGLNAFLVLVGLAGGLGLVGLANTMAVSMLERYREIGLLRAIGARKRQIRGMALVESATLVGVAFVLAVPMGILVSAPLVNFGARLVGDFTVHYVFPWVTLPLLAVAGAGAAAVTAIGPARRATRIDIEAALRFE